MADQKFESILARVRTHAFGQLPFDRRTKTNLHVDERIIAAGETLGPSRQKIAVKRPSILVFADDQPDADFSHNCRYLFYDVETGNLHDEITAQFPPFTAKRDTFKVFHEPVKLEPSRVLAIPWPQIRLHGPILIPDGNRFAILFSGMSNYRHLNNLEFLYRTLVDDYAFKPENIHVLNFDGTLKSQDGIPPNYAGDHTAFRMKIDGKGTRTDLDAAIDDFKTRIKSHDLLFLYTGNHGGWDNSPNSADLCTWDPDPLQWYRPYHATDLAAKLGQLPRFRDFLVMMSQCHSGGFNQPILASSKADNTSVAASVIEPEVSSITYDFNIFGREWTSAQHGLDPYGHGLAFNPDMDGDGAIQAEEAFYYAYAQRPSGNDPFYRENPEAGGDITLGQHYRVVFWWDKIVVSALRQHLLHLPPEQYFARVHAVQPQLTKLAMELDTHSKQLQEEFAAKVEKLIVQQAAMAA